MTRTPAQHDNRLPRIRERGASVLEAAMIMSLAVVPLVTVIGHVQEKQTDNVEASADRIGYPTEPASLSTPVTVPGGNTGDNTGPTPTSGVETYLTMSSSVGTQGQNWTATIVIDVTDIGGTTQSNGSIEGTWTLDDGTTKTATCTIDTNGQCTVTTKLKKSLSSTLVFDVATMTSDDLVLAPGEEAKTVTVTAP